ncbi:MAG TPA: hypothetical protein VHM25_15875, partial [Polyangiaceae bacterium]|nr:hypothetical protein [Polyangiaceae bacterium]
MSPSRQTLRLKIAIGSALAVALAGTHLYREYVADGAPERFDSPIEHFKYGSYGSEKTGLPYPGWKSLPQVCSELLPSGWS